MAKQPDRKGRFVQFGNIDQELAERFRAACRAVGSDAGEELSQFMRDFLSRTIVNPAADAPAKPKPKGKQ